MDVLALMVRSRPALAPSSQVYAAAVPVLLRQAVRAEALG